MNLVARCYEAQGAEEIFGENFPLENLGTQLRVSVHGLLRSPSPGSPMLGMILILPLGMLAQVHQNGNFVKWCPLNPPPPQVPRRAQSMEKYLGDFIGEILALQRSGLGHPKDPCKDLYKKSLHKIRARKSVQESHDVQIIHARKSVQKIRAKQIRAFGFLIVALQIEKSKFYNK